MDWIFTEIDTSIIAWFIDLYSEAEGLWSNPLIQYTVIKGLAVGLFIR